MPDLSAAELPAAARGATENCDSIKRDSKFVERVREACRSGEEQLLDRLIQSKVRDHVRALLDKKDLEHECVVGGSIRCLEIICKLLCLLPCHINRKNKSGYSCLHMAVLTGHTDIVDFLLVNEANVNITDNDQHSPLYHAIVLNNEKLVRRLLNANADVHVADRFQATPLHYAVQMCQDGDAGAINIVKMLLDRVSTVEMRDSEGRTPLVWASSSGSLSAVQLLIKSKAIRKAADKDGLTALHCAAGHGYCQIIQALVCGTQDQFVNVEDSFGCPPIFYAASHEEHQAMSTLLHLGADADYQDKKGRTVSHCAAALGKPTLLRELEEKGANLWIKSHKQDIHCMRP
ncbi:hypothetical protein EB796_023593 [Bugula neritina]|uniref:Uncharacterized protein n=1 Tax=Bugula neritina TaxID=10212 RepID=A0A7J7IW23_BUGNE|nr:hypothetical protein EB796_023593 [Bugula neritina]